MNLHTLLFQYAMLLKTKKTIYDEYLPLCFYLQNHEMKCNYSKCDAMFKHVYICLVIVYCETGS